MITFRLQKSSVKQGLFLFIPALSWLLKRMSWLSLDVVAGSVISSFFFADLLQVTIPLTGMACLAGAVWICYTVDHLLDAVKIGHIASTGRHAFHQKYFKEIFLVLMVVLCVEIVLVWMLFWKVLIGGVVLSLFIGAYFIFHKSLKGIKEFFGSLLYCGGVLVVPFSFSDRLMFPELLIIIQFYLMVLTNLILFSLFDRNSDVHDGHASFVLSYGSSATRILIRILLILQAVICSFVLWKFGEMAYQTVLLSIMGAVLAMLYIFKDYFSDRERFRLPGDGIFLLPLVYLILFP